MPDTITPPASDRHPGSVRHERKDANLRIVVLFGVSLILGALAIHVVLWWMLAGLEKQRDDHEGDSPLPADVREQRPRFPAQLDVMRTRHGATPLQVADTRDMEKQRAAEDAVLSSYGWSDAGRGTVRMPIDEALRIADNPAAAKAHGIVAQPLKGKAIK